MQPLASELFGIEIGLLQTICIFATTLILAITLIYAAVQLRILRRQTKHLSTSVRSQIYYAIYNRMTEMDQYFVDNPELKAYVYGEQRFPDDLQMQRRVMSACEMLADLFQEVVQLHKETEIDRENWLGWNRYMRTIYDSSHSFRHFFDVNGQWYTIDLASTLVAPAGGARVPCRLRLDRPRGNELDEDIALWDIYDEAIPADEKEPRSVICSTISERKGSVIRAQHKQGHLNSAHTMGFAVVHLLRKPKVKFLVYIAVNRAARGHGVGSQLLAEVINCKAAKATVVEVDDPECAESIADREARTLRLSFFAGAGFRLLTRNYWQPPLAPGKNAVRMLLMAQGVAPFSAEEVIKAIYDEKYRAMNGLSQNLLGELHMRMLDVS